MSFWHKVICVGAVAIVSNTHAALGDDHPPDGLVVFVNAGSDSVTVSVDGAIACTIEPGSTCSAVLNGTDSDMKHPLHADMGSRTWDDSIRISECHFNWMGPKTFTFSDENVSFACKSDTE